MARPVLPLADLTPEPSRIELGTSMVVMLFLVNGVVGVISVISFFRPQPALHKQFADRDETDKKLDRIVTQMETLGTKFEHYQSEQSGRRRKMYSRLAKLENAMTFFSSKLSEHDLALLERSLSRLEDAPE